MDKHQSRRVVGRGICASGSCPAAEKYSDDTVELFATREGVEWPDAGRTRWTGDEFRTFVDRAKNGDYDNLI